MSRAFQIFATVVLAATFGLVLLICYWLLVPDRVVTMPKQVVAVNKQKYLPGERIVYTFSYCKTRPIVGKVSRALVNGVRMTYETVMSDLPVGCHTTDVCSLVIPEFMPRGVYHIDVTAEYQVNPLRTHTVRFKTEEFEVVKP